MEPNSGWCTAWRPWLQVRSALDKKSFPGTRSSGLLMLEAFACEFEGRGAGHESFLFEAWSGARICQSQRLTGASGRVLALNFAPAGCLDLLDHPWIDTCGLIGLRCEQLRDAKTAKLCMSFRSVHHCPR